MVESKVLRILSIITGQKKKLLKKKWLNINMCEKSKYTESNMIKMYLRKNGIKKE